MEKGTERILKEHDIHLVRYQPDYKNVWNQFVESSKNGTFLFNRDYMDYHSDRYKDFSFLFFRKNKLYCLFPASYKDKIVYSHQGLTYGGLIMNMECRAEIILQIFDLLLSYLKKEGYIKLIYKPIPHIYHKLPSEEDLYSLFRYNASLIGRNISSALQFNNRIQPFHDRIAGLKKAIKSELTIRETTDFKGFWDILSNNLKTKYGVSPVHTLKEIQNLASLFPDNIKLWGAYKKENLMGAVVCYVTSTVVHTQYISASDEGKKQGAVDLILDFLIKNYSSQSDRERIWLDFGTSNEEYGRILNTSLIYQKEGLGGRAICYDTYEINLERI